MILNQLKRLSGWASKNKSVLLYILGLFFITRLALLAIGYFGFQIFASPIALQNECLVPRHDMFSNLGVNMWLGWDSGHYFTIAQTGYEAERPNFGFFPLYPLVVMSLYLMTSLAVAIAGLIVSNLALLFACWFIYKLVRLDHSEETAKRAIKYLLLLPAGFVFSGMLTEAMFVALALGAFYYARLNKWFTAGVLGGCLALTRSVGVFVAIPLFIEYMAQRKFRPLKIRWNILALALIPIGLSLYMAYNYHLLGDYLGFANIQEGNMYNPLSVLWNGLSSRWTLPVVLTSLMILLQLFFAKKLRLSYWVYGAIFTLIPIITGAHYLPSLLRYMTVVFPIAIILALVTKHKAIDDGLTIGLALLQGLLMVLWVNCWMVYLV